MQMQGEFNAQNVKPIQALGGHPPGVFDFIIEATEIKATKDNTGGMFVVTFKTPAGQIQNRYNLWNNSEKAVEIAHGQLSALCHATGIFQVRWPNEGRELIGGRGKIQVGYQSGQEPTPEKPEGGYVEIKKVLDAQGNEPGKVGAAQLQPQQVQQPSPPMQQNPQGGWTQPQQTPQQPPPNQSWAPPAQPNPQQTAPQGNPSWTQQQPNPQGGGQAAPPWAQR